MNQNDCRISETIYYSITGRAAHGRIAPLLPIDWIDVSPYSTNARAETIIPNKIHFLWENAPRKETKDLRNLATVYSHLPNGISILDDKWNLARLLKPHTKTRLGDNTIITDTNHADSDSYYRALESHVFRGRNGFDQFCQRAVKVGSSLEKEQVLYDLHPQFAPIVKSIPSNTWVIKDAQANGYGGIWFVTLNDSNASSSSISTDITSSSTTSINNNLIPFQNHRYVAQKYVWPMVLYQHRKCHIRVYAILVNGYAFVHRRCFLHVANQVFGFDDDDDNHLQEMDPSIHITNCCANSHDKCKFAGEICANFERTGIGTLEDGVTLEIGLEPFFPSVCASVRELARTSQGFLQGGEMNHGFEYLGLDFILSYETDQTVATTSTSEEGSLSSQRTSVAYLLEVNCPPSQDTATGLRHAEDLHNEVLSDWMHVHVIPTIQGKFPVDYSDTNTRGWKCVYRDCRDESVGDMNKIAPILPSKAAILNKIKWQLFERKCQRDYEKEYELTQNHINSVQHSDPTLEEMISFVRSQFPYFQNNAQHAYPSIFLENAGGSQVPIDVITAVTKSLSHRHRDIIGAKTKLTSRKILRTILGADENDTYIYLGLNATSLFDALAHLFENCPLLVSGDNIILATENHLANVTPWVNLAQKVGMNVKWWKCRTDDGSSCLERESDIESSVSLSSLLNSRTKIVCISHASNILGSVRDLKAICSLIRQKSPRALIVCDGVAAVPHLYTDFSNLDIDFYIISCHKLFGSHLGALCAKSSIRLLAGYHRNHEFQNDPYSLLEKGTYNFESCAGILGIGSYFERLSNFERGFVKSSRTKSISTVGDNPKESSLFDISDEDIVCESHVKICYEKIRMLEESLLRYVVDFLGSCSKVRIIKDDNCTYSLPILSFVHDEIDADNIVRYCKSKNIFVRSGSFLSTSIFQFEFMFTSVVRASFCHYNTIKESKRFVEVLKSMKGWN